MAPEYDTLPGKSISLWLDTTSSTYFPALQNDLEVDVAVIGGGIVGITSAALLKEAGKKVAVLEARRVGEGVTGNTTAKITSLHTLIYAYLREHFGQEKAYAYGAANEAAIAQIAHYVEAKRIDCDFTRTVAYTYTESDDDVDKSTAEVKAAQRLGLPASFTTETPLPFSVKAAIRFDNQAQFHPRKYLLALAEDIDGEGSCIFENTQATDFTDGAPCTVTTNQGTVTARAVIVASHFPLKDKALYTTRLKPHRSYVLAARLADLVPQGTFISTNSAHTLRNHQMDKGTAFLLVGGEGHPTGKGGDTIARYKRIEQWTRDNFEVEEIRYRWATQDNETLDRLPYIGHYSPVSDHVYVATGFGGWGMTNGTAAGLLLRDLIVGQENPWAGVYDPNRLNLASVPDLAKQGAKVVKHFVGDRLPSPEADSVAPGEGRIVRTEEGAVALYRGEDGTISTLSPACTHLGCFVQWNPAERSWDCPCHGSRFAADGEVLHGPATEDLEKIGKGK